MLTGSKTAAVTRICFFLLAISGAGFAQDTAAVSKSVPAASKIAFVNMQEALATCNEGKQEAATLQQQFAAKTNAIKGQDGELKKLKDDYQAVVGKLNDNEKSVRLNAIQEKQKAFDRNVADYKSEIERAQQEAITRIANKMQTVLNKYAVANGYTAVIDLSNTQSLSVIWIKRDSLITKELVDLYNGESSDPAPPAATAPGPRKP